MTLTPALLTHIIAGGVGLTTGSVALAVRKGERLHRVFGTMFVASMLVMAAMATWLGITIPGQMGNAYGGAFTFYLIATAWLTIRRREGTIGRIEIAAFLAAAAIAGLAVIGSFLPPPADGNNGVPRVATYMFAAVAMLAAATDLRVILRGGISGVPRIARHLWRMCVGLFVASGSFFLGKQQDMPAFVRGSPVLIALAVAPLVLMVFWLFRVRFSRQFRTDATAPQGA